MKGNRAAAAVMTTGIGAEIVVGATVNSSRKFSRLQPLR
jgi:hypothetical protein